MPGTLTELPKKRGRKPNHTPEPDPKTPFDEAAKPAETPGAFVKPSKEPFPPWPRGDGKGGYTSIEGLMQYWNTLPPEFIARTNFYVNRDHPKLDRLQELTPEQRSEIEAKHKREPAKYIDKPAEPWREKDTRMAFLRRYGSGDYRVYLNDAGASGAEAKKNPELKSRCLCKAKFSVWDTDYPPVLDPSRPDRGLGILDWTFPANQSYIAELRTKGILPPNAKREEDVPNEVVNKLVDQVGTLADKVAAQETDRLVDRIAEKVGGQGNGNAVGQIVDVMRAAKEFTQAPAAAAAPSAETQMTGVLSLVEKIMTMKAENPMVDLYKLQLQNTMDEMKEYRQETRRLQEQLSAKKNGDGDSSFEAMIDKIEKMAPKLTNLLGLAGDKATDVIHGRRRGFWEDLALTFVPQLAPGLNTLMGAAANYFLMPGRPNGLAGPPPGQQQLPAGATQTPAAADPMEPTRQRLGMFLGQNLKPMQSAFEKFLTKTPRNTEDPDQGTFDGTDFAAWIAEYHDAQLLRDARALGSAQLVQMFEAAPAIWAAIKPNEAKFRTFLDQVLAFIPDEEEPAEEEGATVDLTGE